MKHKGRKIYKTKEKNYYGKSPGAKLLQAGLTVLLMGGIVFLGYSVAEPIINYTSKQGDDVGTAATTETTDASQEISGTVLATDSNGQLVSPESVSLEQYKAAALTVNDLSSQQALQTALEAVPKDMGIEFVEVPLKAKGGNIYYNCSYYDAQIAGAVQSYMTASDIANAITEAGFRPAAVISTFCDSVMPYSFPGTGYTTINDGSQWLDNDPSSGGKPWMSPYSESALSYLSYLVDEAAVSGFERIICSDLVYPMFRETDLTLLDERLGRSDRYMAMTSAANLLYDRALTNGSRMLVEISAADILKGSTDVMQPMLLNANTIIVNINIDEISPGVSDGWTVYEFTGTPAEMTKKMLGFISDKLSDFNVAIRLSGTSVPVSELIEAKEELAGFGFTSFVIG